MASRITTTAAIIVVQNAIRDHFIGGLRKEPMNKVEMTKKFARLAGETLAQVALKDALAKSASKRYTEDGKKVPGTKKRMISKESLIELGLSAGSTAFNIASVVGGMKARRVMAERAANEARFRSWGGNILNQGMDGVVHLKRSQYSVR